MEQKRFRIDWVFDVQEVDKLSGVIKFIMKPDPRRYEWRKLKGKRYLCDRFDNFCIAEKAIKQMFEESRDTPVFFERQEIDSAAKYAEERRVLIRKTLSDGPGEGVAVNSTDDHLKALGTRLHEFVIMSVDIVASTTLALAIPDVDYRRTIQVVLHELSDVVSRFHGFVLKHTGDGILAYFPAPSFIRKNDLALDCALTIIRLIYTVLNPELVAAGLRGVDIRIGIESGEAEVLPIGNPSTKIELDVVGRLLNLACKIQERAPIGGIALGETAARNLHVTWRQSCTALDGGEVWTHRVEGKDIPYRLFSIRLSDFDLEQARQS